MPYFTKKFRRKISNRRLSASLLVAAPVIGLLAWGMATNFGPSQKQGKAFAITQDSWVQIEVNAPGLSNVTLTSQNYSFGDCNGAPGQDFNAPVTCGGVQFGPPSGVLLEMAYVPSGYQDGQWSVVSNSTDGTVSCQSYGCMFNFYSGTAIVNLVVNPIPPKTPSLSASSATTNSLKISWTNSGPSGSGPVNYKLYQNGALLVSTTSTSFLATGLKCGTSYSYYVKATNQEGQAATSGTLKASTSSCPATNPPPSSKSSGSTSTGSQGSGSSSAISTQGISKVPATQSSASPVAPTDFQLSPVKNSTVVQLSWSPGDSLNLPDYYQIDRSSDGGKTWVTLTNTISGSQTTYQDDPGEYNTTFSYRLSALDLSGHRSSYLTANVTTSPFSANLEPNSSITLTTPDKLFTLQIPPGATGKPLSCSAITSNSQISIPSPYKLASPIYTLACQDSTGASVPLLASVAVAGTAGHYAKLGYLGQPAGPNPAIKPLDNSHNVNFVLGPAYTGFVLVGVPASTPFWVKLLIIVPIILAMVLAIIWLIRRHRYNKALEDIDSQYRKEWGL